MSQKNLWVAQFAAQRANKPRLFCFPFSGGGATFYRDWIAQMPEFDVCPIQLPGRENRLKERAFTSLFQLIPELAKALGPLLTPPYVFFGHSMGGLIAFELIRHLRRQEQALPKLLIVSAHRAPHLPDPDPNIHKLPDDAFIESLLKHNPEARQIFEHKELRDMVLPFNRADAELCETYQHVADRPIAVPTLAIAGEADCLVPNKEVEPWSRHTTGGFRLELMPGDHFYLKDQIPVLYRLILQTYQNGLSV